MPTLDQADVLKSYQTMGKAEFFYKYVRAEIERRGAGVPVVLDIGCGGGFHHRDDLQTELGRLASRFIGVEPDPEAKLNPAFHEVKSTVLEDAGLPANSVDVAFSVMVMEHVTQPEAFFETLHHILRPGGAYLGFTVDARHWFSKASSAMAKTGIKDRYLNGLRGKRGEERYENFPTAYLCNTPGQFESLCKNRLTYEWVSLHKVGQMDYYLPGPLRGISHALDKLTLSAGWPGSCMLFVARKA